MPDSAGSIARDLIAEVGRGPALGYLFGRLVGAETWHAARQALRLIWAVVAA